MKQLKFYTFLAVVLISCKQEPVNKTVLSNKVPEKVAEAKKEIATPEEDEEEPEGILFRCKANDSGKSIYDDPLNKICECDESTFALAYDIFYKEAPSYLRRDLVKKLPEEDFEWKTEAAVVTYKWILNDTLKIDMSFQGGDNHYIFYKNSNDKIEYKEYLGLP